MLSIVGGEGEEGFQSSKTVRLSFAKSFLLGRSKE
jgi:hypothetical protein